MTPIRETLKVVLVGHVGHGKSTIVGRLLDDTGNPKAERDQAGTIEADHIVYRTDARDYVLIDAPGDHKFPENMISGAAMGDAALLIIDANEGVREQTRRHDYLLHLLGLDHIIVAVNKMDRVGFEEKPFKEICSAIGDYFKLFGIAPQSFIPVAGRDGDNIAKPSERMAWYRGPVLANAMAQLPHRPRRMDKPLRLPVQDIYKSDGRRFIAGRLASGRLRVGDKILCSPSNNTATVSAIESRNSGATVTEAEAGQSIGLTLDEPIPIERGEVISHEADPPVETDVFKARMFWLGAKPLTVGAQLRMKLNTSQASVEIQAIEQVFDLEDLSRHPAQTVERNGIAEVIVHSSSMLALDEYGANSATGRFVLLDGDDMVGGGVISIEGYPDQRSFLGVPPENTYVVDHTVATQARWSRNSHRGAVFWLTGLSASGKSTIAIGAENRLFDMGMQVYVLDGDNVRRGLTADLGFAPEDRAENIRRVGEVAALFAEAGFIVITAFISPYRSDRERVRNAVPGGTFHEIFVKASVEACEKRDPKGLYAKARAGTIAEFTGITAPYDEPVDSELVIDTETLSPEDAIEALVAYCRESTVL